MVPYTIALDQSTNLPVCFVVNRIHDGIRYHLVVVQNTGNKTLYRNVNIMTGVGLQPTPPE